jgi:hypothetical protein
MDKAWQRLDSISAIYFNKESAAQREASILFLRKGQTEIKNKTMSRDGEETGTEADLLSSRLVGYWKEQQFRDKSWE